MRGAQRRRPFLVYVDVHKPRHVQHLGPQAPITVHISQAQPLRGRLLRMAALAFVLDTSGASPLPYGLGHEHTSRWLQASKWHVTVVTTVSTHEHVIVTPRRRGDTPQFTSKETCPVAQYANNSVGAFEDPKPHTSGRDPVWTRGGYGLP